MDEERRKYGGLSERQFETLKTHLREDLKTALKEEIWNDIYAAIGKTVITRLLFFGGAALTAVVAWLHGAGKIPFIGGE